MATDGQGGIWSCEEKGLGLLATSATQWDNHLIGLGQLAQSLCPGFRTFWSFGRPTAPGPLFPALTNPPRSAQHDGDPNAGPP